MKCCKPIKHGIGVKAPLSLIDPHFLMDMASVLKGGEEKYGERNWMKENGLPWEALSDSMMRHVLEFNSGESHDKDSGLHPLVHVACNAMMLYHYDTHRARYGLRDNRRFAEHGQQVTVEELQSEIRAWADLVFPDRTMGEMLVKLREEVEELDGSGCVDPREYADIAILTLDMASVAQVNLAKAVKDKMEINRRREWERKENGTMQHIPAKKE